MPCFCDIVDHEKLGQHRVVIKSYATAIVAEMREIDNLGDLRGDSILDETLKLIEHLYTGRCDERIKRAIEAKLQEVEMLQKIKDGLEKSPDVSQT